MVTTPDYSNPSMTPRPPKDAEHLSDGVYASYDGYHVWLWAERGNVMTGQYTWHRIALDVDVFEALDRYTDRVFGDKL